MWTSSRFGNQITGNLTKRKFILYDVQCTSIYRMISSMNEPKSDVFIVHINLHFVSIKALQRISWFSESKFIDTEKNYSPLRNDCILLRFKFSGQQFGTSKYSKIQLKFLFLHAAQMEITWKSGVGRRQVFSGFYYFYSACKWTRILAAELNYCSSANGQICKCAFRNCQNFFLEDFKNFYSCSGNISSVLLSVFFKRHFRENSSPRSWNQIFDTVF